ncbi:hypothetical protein [Roseivirga misakiensis]|uniref:Uncharacterized protein n=1 Tax=Roseivirga misakiensis TaxID=1563681 RepID=A0A1E5T5P9_9BACT|nr:hypothetical protein [Roseivirga misakiensis]OEK06714.1 hypothetical protein BFP71_03365 [Roseivirga misakiensis]
MNFVEIYKVLVAIDSNIVEESRKKIIDYIASILTDLRADVNHKDEFLFKMEGLTVPLDSSALQSKLLVYISSQTLDPVATSLILRRERGTFIIPFSEENVKTNPSEFYPSELRNKRAVEISRTNIMMKSNGIIQTSPHLNRDLGNFIMRNIIPASSFPSGDKNLTLTIDPELVSRDETLELIHTLNKIYQSIGGDALIIREGRVTSSQIVEQPVMDE